MKKIKQALGAALAIIILLTPITAQAAQYSPLFDVEANYVYMVNLDTDTVMFEKNAHEKTEPASLAKIMTTILAIENIPDLDNTTISLKQYLEEIVYVAGREFGGVSTGAIKRNEELTARQLLYASMLPSANEAALMLADYVGDGSLDYFCQMMNAKAKELGANNTNFANANGLPNPNNYTTAYDMYLITKYALENPEFVKVISETTYSTGPTNMHDNLTWKTTNQMMLKDSQYYASYIQGVKTGFTEEAGRCLVSTAVKDGYHYLMVVMDAPYQDAEGKDYPYSVNKAFEETKKLYNWCFETFKIKTLIEKGESVGEVPLKLVWNKDHVKLMSDERYQSLIPDDIDVSSITKELELPNYIKAPINKGDFVGYIKLSLAGEEIGKVPVVSVETVSRNELLYYVDVVGQLLTSFWLKFIIIMALLLVVLYIGLMILRHRNRRRYNSVKRRKNL